MAQPLNIEFSFTEFDATLKQYMALSRKTSREIVLRKSMELAGGFGKASPGALQLTHRAEAEKIKAQLSRGVSQELVLSTKGKTKGKFKRSNRKIVIDDERGNLAARIINSRLVREGKPPIWGADLAKKAQKLIAARARSVGYIASGWIAAIKGIAPKLGRSPTSGGTKVFGEPEGDFVDDTGNWNNPAVTIINQAFKGRDPKPSQMMTVAEDGLRKAVQKVTASMRTYIAKKLQADADKFNAK
jgi:hypothetical protein